LNIKIIVVSTISNILKEFIIIYILIRILNKISREPKYLLNLQTLMEPS